MEVGREGEECRRREGSIPSMFMIRLKLLACYTSINCSFTWKAVGSGAFMRAV